MSAEEDVYYAMETAVMERLSPREIFALVDEAYIEAIQSEAKLSLRAWELYRKSERAGQ